MNSFSLGTNCQQLQLPVHGLKKNGHTYTYISNIKIYSVRVSYVSCNRTILSLSAAERSTLISCIISCVTSAALRRFLIAFAA